MLISTEKNKGTAGPPIAPDAGRGGENSRQPESSFPISKGQIGLWVLLTGITMLFAGLSSAYIVLRGAPAWQNIEMPKVLWLNTFLILASSITMELTRRSIRRNGLRQMKRWLGITGLMGLGFISGQLVAWKQLVNAGVYLPSTLHSSFFYVLTGVHGIHLLGGVAGLAYVLAKACQNRLTAYSHDPLNLCATYWHFMAALWAYLFLLLLLA